MRENRMPAFKAGALDHSAKLPMNGVRGRIRTCVGLTGCVATSFLRPLGHPYKPGSGGRGRTCDIVVNSHALYQLSYTGKIHGGKGWGRTSDTRLFRPLLYRLSYRSMRRWGARPASNRRPPGSQPGTLPTELQAPQKVESHTGFEPVVYALKGRCLRPLDEWLETELHQQNVWLRAPGFEPGTFGL